MSRESSFEEEMEDSKKRHSILFIVSGFRFLDYLRKNPKEAEMMRKAYEHRKIGEIEK